jgi:hypothetical protein
MNISEMRASQKKGSEGEGLNETDCTELNATQGHEADIREHVDAERLAEKIRSGMMDNEDADNALLDRTDKKGWPNIVEI